MCCRRRPLVESDLGWEGERRMSTRSMLDKEGLPDSVTPYSLTLAL